MAQVIAIVNQKGGVGKTTTAVNLCAVLAKNNQRTLLVDLDPQANATSGLGLDYSEIEKGIYEVLIGAETISDCLAETKYENLYILPSTMSLAGASVELVSMPNRESILLNQVNNIRDAFDFILIDCPPSLGILTINGLMASDSVLIPVQAEYYALEGLGQLLNTIGLVQDNLKSELVVLGAVVTMYDRRNRIAKQVVEELHNYFPYYVFKTLIPRNVRLTESPSHGQTILEYEPNCSGAQAYIDFGKEVMKFDDILNRNINKEEVDNSFDHFNEPAEDTEPVADTEPVESAADTEPVEPVADTEPVEPAADTEPVESVEDIKPVADIEPVESVEKELTEIDGVTENHDSVGVVENNEKPAEDSSKLKDNFNSDVADNDYSSYSNDVDNDPSVQNFHI